MAKLTVNLSDEYASMLSQLVANADALSKQAIYEGAKVAADAIKAEIGALPEGEYHILKKGQKFGYVPTRQKEALQKGLGIAAMERDKNGDWNAKIGFNGYGSNTETKKYPKGLPVAMLARSVESGSSVRNKTPFVRPAMQKAKNKILAAMERTVDEAITKIVKK